MNTILLGVLAGAFIVLALQAVLFWALKGLGLIGNPTRELTALEHTIRADTQGQLVTLKGDVDTRVLHLIEQCNKSIATLQAQIAANPYYEYDAKGAQRVAERPAAGMPKRENEEYLMSNGAGGV